MRVGISRRIFLVVNGLIMVILAGVCLLPIWHVLMASISNPALVDMANGFILRPLGDISFRAYELIFAYKGIWIGYKNTIFYVIAQSIITTVFTLVAGYVLSRRRFRYRGVLMAMITFTMLFNGGLIPTYMVVRKLHLLDTYWALLIPRAMEVFYIIIMRTAMMAIPESLEESARIDGANDITILMKIIVPLSKATISVIILFVAVAKWNDWFQALIYLPTARDKYPLQMYMREILIMSNNAMTDAANASDLMDSAALYKTLAKYAAIVMATLPILMIYPFVQKYFVTGVMIGSVKG